MRTREVMHEDLRNVQQAALVEECRRATRVALDNYNRALVKHIHTTSTDISHSDLSMQMLIRTIADTVFPGGGFKFRTLIENVKSCTHLLPVLIMLNGGLQGGWFEEHGWVHGASLFLKAFIKLTLHLLDCSWLNPPLGDMFSTSSGRCVSFTDECFVFFLNHLHVQYVMHDEAEWLGLSGGCLTFGSFLTLCQQ